MTAYAPDLKPRQSLRRPPRVPTVVRDPSDLDPRADVDWSSWYLTGEADMGQSPLQGDVALVLHSSVTYLARERNFPRSYIGIDTFFGWLESEPLVRISPDIYLVFEPPEPLPKSFQTWRPGHNPPALAVEIVSDDWRKDYGMAPEKYDLLGTEELVIFDPAAALDEEIGAGRVPIQLYRRSQDGLFVRVKAGRTPAWSQVLGAAFASRLTDAGPRLRLTRDELGHDLIPTVAEAEAQRAEAEAQRAEAEAQRADSAEAELAKLRAELERLKG